MIPILLYGQIVGGPVSVDAGYLFGSVITAMLIVIWWFLRSAMNETKSMLQKHEDMLTSHDKQLFELKYEMGSNNAMARKILDKLDYLNGNE